MKRISRVTTRAGDSGQSTLADGSRLNKTDPRFDAIGDVDELNSFVGVLITHLPADGDLAGICAEVHQSLFDLGGSLATVGAVPCPALEPLDEQIATLNAELPPLTEFVLPGGTPAAAAAHVCRAVCRRAERSLWRLGSDDALPAARYLNRLSDLLFVIARTCNAGRDEPQWRGSRPPAD